MKSSKFLAILLSALIACASMNVPVSAERAATVAVEDISLYYENALSAKSYLTISLTTAECTSKCTGASNVVQITVEQTLQKYWGLWIWNDVDDASWSTTESGSYACVVNTKSGLSSGTYRVKSVFTLTTSSGKTETITIYSEEKVVP